MNFIRKRPSPYAGDRQSDTTEAADCSDCPSEAEGVGTSLLMVRQGCNFTVFRPYVHFYYSCRNAVVGEVESGAQQSQIILFFHYSFYY